MNSPTPIASSFLMLCFFLSSCTATMIPLEKPWTPQKIAEHSKAGVRVWRTDGSDVWLYGLALEGADPNEMLHGAYFVSANKQYVECAIPLGDVSQIEVVDSSASRRTDGVLVLVSIGMIALWIAVFAALLG